MSPSRGTPPTHIRVPLDLKQRVQEKAAREGTTLTAVTLAAYRRYLGEREGDNDE